MNRWTLTATCVAAALLAGSAFAQMKAPDGVMTPAPGAAAPGSAPAAAPVAPTAGAPSAPPPPDPMTKEFRECVRASKEAMAAKGQTNFVLIQGCLTAEIKRQEGKMSGAVAKADKNLTPIEKKKLEEVNSAWRRFRDAECGFLADPKGAPPINVENSDCLMNMTLSRVQDMEILAQNAARRAEAKGAK